MGLSYTKTTHIWVNIYAKYLPIVRSFMSKVTGTVHPDWINIGINRPIVMPGSTRTTYMI